MTVTSSNHLLRDTIVMIVCGLDLVIIVPVVAFRHYEIEIEVNPLKPYL